MSNQIAFTQLKRENQALKDLLQDVVPIIGKDKKDFGLIDQEIVARVKAVTGGVKYSAQDWDFTPTNGEQGK